MAIDGNAAAHRRVHGAADGVGVAPELGLVEEEDRPGDDERGHDDRIGQDDVHAAQKLAADLGSMEEMEPAALAGDVVNERIVAVGADAVRQADDGRVLAHEVGDAADDERGPERDDERRHLQFGDDDAVDEADRRRPADAGDEAGDDRGKERRAAIERGAQGQRRKDRGEAHHPADREVDSRADDDEGLTEAEQQHRNDGDENVLGVANREEIDRAAGGQRHRDNEEQDEERRERPTPRCGSGTG